MCHRLLAPPAGSHWHHATSFISISWPCKPRLKILFATLEMHPTIFLTLCFKLNILTILQKSHIFISFFPSIDKNIVLFFVDFQTCHIMENYLNPVFKIFFKAYKYTMFLQWARGSRTLFLFFPEHERGVHTVIKMPCFANYQLLHFLSANSPPLPFYCLPLIVRTFAILWRQITKGQQHYSQKFFLMFAVCRWIHWRCFFFFVREVVCWLSSSSWVW